MDILKYEREEMIPIIMNTIELSKVAMLSLAFRCALEGQYADLKDLVDPDMLDQSAIVLMDDLKDEVTLIIVKYCTEIHILMDALFNLNGLDPEVVCANDNWEQAKDFFYAYVYYPVPFDEEDDSEMDAMENLLSYMCTLNTLYYWLVRLIVDDEVDLDLLTEARVRMLTIDNLPQDHYYQQYIDLIFKVNQLMNQCGIEIYDVV